MKKRRRIGLLANFSEDWMGGLYYIKNVLSALGSLSEEDMPEVILFHHEKTPISLFDEMNYPHYRRVCLQGLPRWQRAMYRIARISTGRNYQLERIFNSAHLDALFPVVNYSPGLKLKTTVFYWIFDFQHKFLPQYFGAVEIARRDKNFCDIARYADHIVFSSEDAAGHFKQFYPGSSAYRHIMRFMSVVDLEAVQRLNITELKKKYNIGSEPYFLVSNQFWQHKNHLIVLKAINLLKHKDVQLILTGLETDPRNSGYTKELKLYVKKNDLHNVKFLGFIPRNEQLSLLRYALAAVQPSRFEGWNTFIEDAKTLESKVVASDLDVHKEQLGSFGLYFNPDDPYMLASHLDHILENHELDYVLPDWKNLAKNQSHRQNKFARQILEILSNR